MITPMDIGNFAPGTDTMDSDAEIENHEILKIIFLIIKVI
jgi:hypothetical protein